MPSFCSGRGRASQRRGLLGREGGGGGIMHYCIFLEQTFPFMRRQKKCVCVVFTEKNFFLWSGSSGDEWRPSAGAGLLRLALIAAV